MPATDLTPDSEQVHLASFVISQVPAGHITPELKAAAEAIILAALKTSTP